MAAKNWQFTLTVLWVDSKMPFFQSLPLLNVYRTVAVDTRMEMTFRQTYDSQDI